MADPKHDETFRVIDRRLFNEEGELRKDVPEQDRRIEEAPPRKPDQGAQTILSPPDRPSTDAGGEAAAAQGAALGNSAGRWILRARVAQLSDAGGLLDAQRRQACWAEWLTRARGRRILTWEGAREMIDMLDALREKTRGNLAKVDDDLLIEVIGSLKLTFMEISKACCGTDEKEGAGKSL